MDRNEYFAKLNRIIDLSEKLDWLNLPGGSLTYAQRQRKEEITAELADIREEIKDYKED
jgi:hypothetical protein